MKKENTIWNNKKWKVEKYFDFVLNLIVFIQKLFFL